MQDFFDLQYENETFSAVIGFYAIVNLTIDEVEKVIAEVHRVLKPNGVLLFSFHVTEEEQSLHVDNFFSEDENPLTFYYFDVEEIKQLIDRVGLTALEIVVRYDYEGAEYPSKRAYILVKKGKVTLPPSY